jgi:hypothetical protein
VLQDVSQLEIPVDDIVFIQMMEAVNELTHHANRFILDEVLFFFEVGVKISVIAVLEDEVVIVIGLFHIVELDDVGAFAAFEYFDFAFEEFLELA